MFLKPPGTSPDNAARAARATPPYPLDTFQVAYAPTSARLSFGSSFRKIDKLLHITNYYKFGKFDKLLHITHYCTLQITTTLTKVIAKRYKLLRIPNHYKLIQICAKSTTHLYKLLHVSCFRATVPSTRWLSGSVALTGQLSPGGWHDAHTRRRR